MTKIRKTDKLIAVMYREMSVFNPFGSNNIQDDNADSAALLKTCGRMLLVYKFFPNQPEKIQYPYADFGCKLMNTETPSIQPDFSIDITNSDDHKIMLTRYGFTDLTKNRLLEAIRYQEAISQSTVSSYALKEETLHIKNIDMKWQEISFRFIGIDGDSANTSVMKLGGAYTPTKGTTEIEGGMIKTIIWFLVVIMLLLCVIGVIGFIIFKVREKKDANDLSSSGTSYLGGSQGRGTDFSDQDDMISSIL